MLEWYRLRWQVELVFKRFKSLAQLGHLPKYDDDSAKAWLYGKLFVALLVEKLLHHARAISSWGYDVPAPVFATARKRPILDSCRPQDVAVIGASSDPQLRRVLTVVKARRSAPPPLRGALGLDDGSAHACPDWLLSDDAQP